MDEPDPPRIDDLVADIRRRADERRRTGGFPAGFEHEMAGTERQVVASRPARADLDEARRRVGEVSPGPFHLAELPVESDVPGGALVHKVVRRLLQRHLDVLVRQLNDHAASVRVALDRLIEVVEGGAATSSDLTGQLHAVWDRLAAYARAPEGSDVATAEVARRVARLEAEERARRFRPWFSWDRFDEEFRGTREEIRHRYAGVADLFVEHAPVLDLGSGRGELLELLAERGVEAHGIELDGELAAGARERGLEVVHEDALQALAGASDASLGGVVAIQLVEHLTAQQVVDLVLLAFDKLRPGGLAVVETVNPGSLYVHAHALYLDPSHHGPVHPAYLSFVFREAGFARVELEWRAPPGDGERLEGTGANVERLNHLLFGPQDYVLVARR